MKGKAKTLLTTVLYLLIGSAAFYVGVNVPSYVAEHSSSSSDSSSSSSSGPSSDSGNTTVVADRDIGALITYREVRNARDDAVYEQEADDLALVEFKPSDKSKTEAKSLSDADLSSFTSLQDSLSYVFFVKNTGENPIGIAVSAPELSDKNTNVRAEIIDNNESKKIVSGGCYVFFLKWSLTSFEENVENSLEDFEIVMSCVK